jgi:hypothetical protein
MAARSLHGGEATVAWSKRLQLQPDACSVGGSPSNHDAVSGPTSSWMSTASGEQLDLAPSGQERRSSQVRKNSRGWRGPGRPLTSVQTAVADIKMRSHLVVILAAG